MLGILVLVVATNAHAQSIVSRCKDDGPLQRDAERRTHERELDETVDYKPYASAPLIVGATFRTNENGTGLGICVRPEFVLARVHRHRFNGPRTDYGIGAYMSAMTTSGDMSRETFLGGGGTVVFYRDSLGAAVSRGAEKPGDGPPPVALVSGLLGFRTTSLDVIDIPGGIRIDGRLGPANQSSLTVGLQIDVLGLLAVGSFLFRVPR